MQLESNVGSSCWGTLPELSEVVELAQDRRIGVHVERFSFDEAPFAYEKSAAGDLTGRAVVVF